MESNLLNLGMQFFAEDTGANGAGSADPQTETGTQTVDAGASKPAEGNPDAAEQGNGTQTQQPPQTPEQNHDFAAARREAESALKNERAKFARTTELIKNYGAANGCFSDKDVETQYGTQGIHTLEDLAKEVDRQNSIQQTGVDPKAVEDTINKLVQNNPLFKSMQEEQNRAAGEKQLTDFKLDFPDVQIDPEKGMEQFDNAESMQDYLAKGLTLSEAYALANRKAIQSKSTAAGKQQAINELGSKSHIKPTGDGVDISNITVPAETERMYKQWFPKWDAKKIKEEYAKSLKD